MVTTPSTLKWRGQVSQSADPGRTPRAVRTALVTLILAALVGALVIAFERGVIAAPGVAGATRVSLPQDLFTAPRTVAPGVVTRYVYVPMRPAPVAATPAPQTTATPMPQSSAMPSPQSTATPMPTPRPSGGWTRPSPSPQPSGGGGPDD